MKNSRSHFSRLVPVYCVAALVAACTEEQPVTPIPGAVLEEEDDPGDPRSLTSAAVADGESGEASLAVGLLQENEELLGLVSTFFEVGSVANLGQRDALEFDEDTGAVVRVDDDAETEDTDESEESYSFTELLSEDVDDVAGDGGGDVDGEILIDGYARVIRPDITSNTVEVSGESRSTMQTITFNNGVVHIIDAVLLPERVLNGLATTVTVEEDNDETEDPSDTINVDKMPISAPVYPISILDALVASRPEEDEGDSDTAFSVFQSLADASVEVFTEGFGGPVERLLPPPEDDEGDEGDGEGDDTEEEVVMTTVFAPTNGAFDAVADSIEIPSQAAADVLTFHTLDGAVLSTDLAEGEVPTNLGPGTPITVTADGTVMPPFVLSPTVSGTPAQLLAVDIEFVDGVVHIIDQVLSPPAGN